MDISLNTIDLEYLTNPLYVKKKTQMQTKSNKNEVSFYRKRIFKLTKDLLCDTYINANMDNAFQNYTKACIKYLKFKDQSEVIQEDYRNLKKKEETDTTSQTDNLDHLMMRKITPLAKTIKDYIPIKIHKPEKDPPFIPVSRKIDLTDVKYRTKGILKKNLPSTYGKTNANKKTKDKTSKKKKAEKEDGKNKKWI